MKKREENRKTRGECKKRGRLYSGSSRRVGMPQPALTGGGSARRPGIHAGGAAGSVDVSGRTRAGYR